MTKIARILALALVPTFLVACVYDNEPPRQLGNHDDGAPASSDPTTDAPLPEPSSSAAPSTTPMLVEIDTDQTMTADPGEGVGVFIEYGAGGKWHVWWTCDTAQTHQTCDYSIHVSVASGTISNTDASELAGGYMTTPTPSSLDAEVTTSTQVHGIRFDTDPGAVITLQASLGDLTDGSFLFFVQDGKVNGGYEGQVTNPLQLQGKTP